MSGFLGGEVDSSAKQRLVMWEYGWNFAKNYPIAGGGFQTLPDADLFQRYASEALPGGFKSTGPHSIYFQMLGDHGFVGLGLFMSLLGSSWFTLRALRRRAHQEPIAQWVVSYSHMIETSLLGYMISGAFLGLAYFDLYFQLIAIIIVIKILWRRESLAVTAPVRIPICSESQVSEFA